MAAAKKRGLGRGLDALLGGDGAGTASPLEQEGELRTLPFYLEGGMDGFFAARLRKAGASQP